MGDEFFMNGGGLAILAGGRATRMEDRLAGVPKALAPIDHSTGKSLLELQVERALRLGVPVWVVADSEPMTKIRERFTANPLFALITDPGRGTGVAVRSLLKSDLPSRMVVMNCDALVPFDVLSIFREPVWEGPIRQHLTARSSQNEGMIGVRDGHVTFWGEPDHTVAPQECEALSSSGIYEIDVEMIRGLIGNAESLELETLPNLVGGGEVSARVHRRYNPTFDFGTVQRYQEILDDPSLRTPLLREMRLVE